MKAKQPFFLGLAPLLTVSAACASLALFTAPSAVAQEFELIVPDATRESCATLGGYMKKGECRVRTTIAPTDELIRVEAESVERDDYLASEIGRVEGQSIATDNDQNAEIGRVEAQSIATDNDQNAEIGRVEAQSLATDEAQNARMDAADESAAQWRKTVNDHSLNIINNSNKISALEAETAYLYDNLAPRLYVKSNSERLGELVPFPLNWVEYHAVTPQGYLFMAMVNRDLAGEPLGYLGNGRSEYGYDNPSCVGQLLFAASYAPVIEDTVGMIFTNDYDEVLYASWDDRSVITEFYFVNGSGECELRSYGSRYLVMPAYPNEPMVTGIPFSTGTIPQPSIGW